MAIFNSFLYVWQWQRSPQLMAMNGHAEDDTNPRGWHGVARILRWNKEKKKVVMKMILIDLDCAISCRVFKSL